VKFEHAVVVLKFRERGFAVSRKYFLQSRARLVELGRDGWVLNQRPLLVLGLVSMGLLGCTRFHAESFEKLYRAGQAVSAANKVGATKIQYLELAQQFGTELAIVKGSHVGSAEERALLQAYEEAGEAIAATATLWNEVGAEPALLVGTLRDESQTRPIVAKYKLMDDEGKELPEDVKDIHIIRNPVGQMLNVVSQRLLIAAGMFELARR
jgi:hypothetical protein